LLALTIEIAINLVLVEALAQVSKGSIMPWQVAPQVHLTDSFCQPELLGINADELDILRFQAWLQPESDRLAELVKSSHS
jgi:hypothetical protein